MAETFVEEKIRNVDVRVDNLKLYQLLKQVHASRGSPRTFSIPTRPIDTVLQEAMQEYCRNDADDADFKTIELSNLPNTCRVMFSGGSVFAIRSLATMRR